MACSPLQQANRAPDLFSTMPFSSTNSSSTGPSVQLPKKLSKAVLISAILYSAFFAITLWAAYHGRLPLQSWLSQFPNYDKVGHLVLYFIPTYLGHRLLRQKHYKTTLGRMALSLPVFPGLFTLFTVTEELIQGLAPHRSLDALDMVCSLAGIAVGYWLAQRHR